MTNNSLLVTCLVGAVAVIPVVELFFVLPFGQVVRSFSSMAQKATRVLSSSAISDHWKEKVMRKYALQGMGYSFTLLLYLLLVAAAFAGAYYIFALLAQIPLAEIAAAMIQWQVQVTALLVAIGYTMIRKKGKGEGEQASDYSPSARLLHYLALNSPLVRKMAFEVDCLVFPGRTDAADELPPVFISGLARGGTTILLETLYSTGRFATLTYRNMPFVTAPYIWKKVTAGQYRQEERKERAHGDRLEVGFDSPEAFEEVFWLTFTDASYVKENCLLPHDPDMEVIDNYRVFVRHITRGDKRDFTRRYLAKNNNNVLRIAALRKAFPEAVIIVPFRNPLDQAHSLSRQHDRFRASQAEDRFSLQYMNWLGHFEFGLNFKPFRFSDDALPAAAEETDEIAYWLRYWQRVYQYLIDNFSDEVIFFDYDEFCCGPVPVLERLSSVLQIDREALLPFAERIKPAIHYQENESGWSGVEGVQETYESLKKLAVRS